MQVKISKTQVDRMTEGQILADKEVKGFVARKLDSGAVTFGYRYRDKTTGRQRWLGLGLHGNITAEQARDFAKKAAGEVADKKDPQGELQEARAEAKREELAAINTVNAVLDAFEKDHVDGLRSGDQVKAAFTNHVRPRIGDKSIYDLKRSDITTLLNEVKAESGPVMADRVLAHVRKAFNWQMVQDDEFKSPIVRGMAKTKPKERARKRILADDEIRDVWAALDQIEQPACYPRFVKSLLLAMTRRNESARMHTDELEGDLWIIPGSRYKNKQDHVIPVPPAISELICERPAGCKKNSWFVFSTTTSGGQLDGAKPFSGFSKAKKELDRIIAEIRKKEGRAPMKQWQLHDLRRTGRSLMSRAKVDADHAERCMGHVIGGVRETYDRYEYLDEKRVAFEALAAMVDMILKPPGQPLAAALEGK
ncbi:integrase arm-type DNA-binding domain-containing protein [Bradyrhizobium sp. 2]|uniref:tyrosine-type recombinase/integrase n=1 Tax=unclassified Bradyrhizobium TaxID=2631580 RepID=UPI001FFB455B|nr:MULTISPECIES: site-specific integrase [unclassified Bradyrhizobium]MCK1443109.1 integrase arm-type DNA-binding domain-containing protein [Bradyrhizobium sp. 48]MCK1460577.1 integrase arm-type DNA-binding domain-containing protein [Bradyrhizobium sp. 2]